MNVQFCGGKEWFRTAFYLLKDRLMERFGRPAGYSLQHWTSVAYESYYDYDGVKNGANHYSILERLKIGRLMLHRPTGHFRYVNGLNGYYKQTDGFSLMAAACVEKSEGKKRVTRNLPTEAAALSAFHWLMAQYGNLLDAPAKPKPRLAIRTGYDDFWDYEPPRRPRGIAAGEPESSIVECAWCLKKKESVEVTKVGGHDLCSICVKKVVATSGAGIGVVEEVSF